MKLIIAGGGTGGHVFPGLAVAEEFLGRSPDNQVLFIGASGGMEEDLLSDEKAPLRLIRSSRFAGQNLSGKIKSLINTMIGIYQTRQIIRQFQPNIILGVGGYVSVPVVIAAFLSRVPRAIHEQNSYPGLANRFLARISNCVLLSFGHAEQFFRKAKKTRFLTTGNPLRKKVLKDLLEPSSEKAENSRFQIFAVGGSQGAKRLNQLMIEAVEHLAEIKNQIKIVHMSGPRSQYDMIIAYSKKGLRAKVYRFVENMGKELKEADLVISRAGAGAIFELALAAKPAIFIPFPYAANNHQVLNAQYLAEKGAARVYEEKDLDGQKLAEVILEFFNHKELREELAQKAKSLAKPEAGEKIVDELIRIAEAKR